MINPHQQMFMQRGLLGQDSQGQGGQSGLGGSPTLTPEQEQMQRLQFMQQINDQAPWSRYDGPGTAPAPGQVANGFSGLSMTGARRGMGVGNMLGFGAMGPMGLLAPALMGGILGGMGRGQGIPGGFMGQIDAGGFMDNIGRGGPGGGGGGYGGLGAPGGGFGGEADTGGVR